MDDSNCLGVAFLRIDYVGWVVATTSGTTTACHSAARCYHRVNEDPPPEQHDDDILHSSLQCASPSVGRQISLAGHSGRMDGARITASTHPQLHSSLDSGSQRRRHHGDILLRRVY